MDDPVTGHHSDPTFPKTTGLPNERLHHRAVGPQQIPLGKRIQILKQGIGLCGILDLENFLRWSEDSFSVKNSRYLFLRQGILFDVQGGVDGANLILPSQMNGQGLSVFNLNPPYELAGFCKQVGDGIIPSYSRRIIAHQGTPLL